MNHPKRKQRELREERPPPPLVRSGSKFSLGPVDSDPDNDGGGDDADDDDSSSGISGSSSSSSSSSSSDSGSVYSSSGSSSSSGGSRESSSSSSSDDDESDSDSDNDGLGGQRGVGLVGYGNEGDDESYNSDSHHSEPIRLNPSSPTARREQQQAGGGVDPPEAVREDSDDDEVDPATTTDDDDDDPATATDVEPEGDDDDDDESVVPGTEALQDAYWDPSSSHSHEDPPQPPQQKEEPSAVSSARAPSSPSLKGETEGGEGDNDEPSDGDSDSEDEGSAGGGSDQGVANVAYEVDDDDVERGGRLAKEEEGITPTANGVSPRAVAEYHEDDDQEENCDFPVVMHPRQKQRSEPPENSAYAAEKSPADDLEAGRLYERPLDYDDEDDEPPDATYGEDVEEGNLEDFAADAKDNHEAAIRAAPTASFSHDYTEAEEHPKDVQQRKKRKRTYAVVAAVIVVVLVAAIVGGVVGSQKGGASTSSDMPTPTQPPSSDGGNPASVANPQLFAMVANASADGGAAILQSGSPQNRAYLSLEAAADEYQPSRWLQRYALRTFYYATNGPTDWFNKSGWDDAGQDQDECLWHQTTLNGTAQGGANPLCNQNHVLQALMLVGNNVTGTLPPELSLLTGLTRFYVKGLPDAAHGSLKGGIPSTLAALTRLEEFALSYHDFDQPIPDGLFDSWSAVKIVEVSESKVPGPFPQVSNLTACVNLNFEGNQLRGQFPADELSRLSQLSVFSVDNNQLSGSFPPASHGLYASLGRLRVLSVANNSLEGTIPPQIGSLTSLKQRLNLSANSFFGRLPTELNLLTSLARLDVSYNQLTGPVPDLSRLAKLKQLALEGNRLTGTMPNGTCGVVVANGATASADCNRGSTAPANGTALFVCPCCTTCCVSVANGACQTRAR